MISARRCRNPFLFLSALGVIALAAAPGIFARPAAVAADTEGRTVWDGVYSAKQAKLGEGLYLANCSQCHAEDLSGDDPYNASPSLAGKAFLLRWDNRTLGDLYGFMSVNMPKTSPGTLKPEEYANILSYILEFNKFPAGKEDLKKDSDELKKITITKEKK